MWEGELKGEGREVKGERRREWEGRGEGKGEGRGKGREGGMVQFEHPSDIPPYDLM